ncbi:low-density lipoprotein receptor-related protein 8-like [Daphnia carinata]|uniref:low-density lipoprotein receptor-related protein 8-like n=1 Tax=Daphnia carinata TaxID=120202 RepID=UPI002579788F|nr:low-density lipoprotein receptor-related protein 8-like [Daphnia carinata]
MKFICLWLVLFVQLSEFLTTGCYESEFRCESSDACIESQQRCDSVKDCEDGSDESDCETAFTLLIITDQQNEFQCDNGDRISLHRVCDGTPHCADGTDEGGNCETSCEHNGPCQHTCLSGPNEPICECEPGYDSLNDGRNCIDIDECKTHFSCSQFCNNTDGDYDCLCIPGYFLDQDKHTCRTINGRPLMIAASAHQIAMLINDNMNSSYRQFEWHDPVKGVAFHDKLSTLYWITNAGVIRSNSLGQALVYKFTSMEPTGLALESITGNLYVSASLELNGGAQQERSIIKVVSHSLESDVNIVNTLTKITDLAIDSVRGILFWSDTYGSSTGRIIRSTLDGKSTRELRDTQIIFPVALALDPITSRIYWADSRQQSILSCTYNGEDQYKHVGTNDKPLSVTFFENRLSWTVLHQDIIYSRQVAGEPMEKALQLPETKAVEHLFTTHSILEPEYPNPCASSPCGNGLCVLKNFSRFSCFCPGDESVISIAPFRCSSRCPRDFFHCHPNSECLPRSLVCINDANCDSLSDRKLCEKLKDSLQSGGSVLTDSLTRGILHSLSVISLLQSNGTDRWIQDITRNENNSLPYLETRIISGPSPSNQSRRKVVYSRQIEIRDEVYVPDESGADQGTIQAIESALQAILGGPVYVRSCLFTKKGHYIDLATMFDRQGNPVPINQVWDARNQTRFVEDIEVSDGSQMILWKIFRPQAYTAESKLRAVDQMELRTLQKMGYLLIDVDLASWNSLTESDRITFLKTKLSFCVVGLH